MVLVLLDTAKQVVSNMRTKSTAKQTNGSGFIGHVYYGNDGWLNNSIAIGEAGEDSTKGSIGKAYNFTSTKGPALTTGLSNCYEVNDGWLNNSIAIGEAGEDSTKGSIGKAYNFTSTKGPALTTGLSNCYEVTGGGMSNTSSGNLDETTEYNNPDFYRNTLKFDGAKWNFASVEKNGYPTLTWIVGEEPLPALPQGSEVGEEPLPALPQGSKVTEHPVLTTNTAGYTEIRTPADFMKIADNPSGKYILMNNISLEQIRLPEGQTSYIMKRFEGELDGNNQVIHGLRASLFDSIYGVAANKKAVVKNLRMQNIFVDAGYKNTQWLGEIRAEANGLARTISNGELNSIYMNFVRLNGGSNTAALAGEVKSTYIGKVWLEGIDINSDVSATDLLKFNQVGGAIGSLSEKDSKFEDSYVSGCIIMDNNEQGGTVGIIRAATIRNVISNMKARSNKPANWREKSGFLGSVAGYGSNWSEWKLDRCISIGDAGDNYKFLGKNLLNPQITTQNLNSCYEYTKATGTTNVSETTTSLKTLLTTDNIHDIAFYRDTLSFNDDTDGADTQAWDFSSVETQGSTSVPWLLT